MLKIRGNAVEKRDSLIVLFRVIHCTTAFKLQPCGQSSKIALHCSYISIMGKKLITISDYIYSTYFKWSLCKYDKLETHP